MPFFRESAIKKVDSRFGVLVLGYAVRFGVCCSRLAGLAWRYLSAYLALFSVAYVVDIILKLCRLPRVMLLFGACFNRLQLVDLPRVFRCLKAFAFSHSVIR